MKCFAKIVNSYNYFRKLQLFLQYQLFMLCTSWNKHREFLNARLIITPEVFILYGKSMVHETTRVMGLRISEFSYNPSKFYSGITYSICLSVFCNLRATIMFIILWDFSVLHQIFVPPEVKQRMIISNKLVCTSCLTKCGT